MKALPGERYAGQGVSGRRFESVRAQVPEQFSHLPVFVMRSAALEVSKALKFLSEMTDLK